MRRRTRPSRVRARPFRPGLLARVHALALGCTLALAAACDTGQGAALDPSLIHTVRRGDLVITVRERGAINAARDSRVTSGKRALQAISVAKVEAALEQARKSVEISLARRAHGSGRGPAARVGADQFPTPPA